MWLELLFWILLGIVIYAYVGYGLVLFILIKLKRLFVGKKELPAISDEELPEVTYLVAAYNEERWIEDKIENSLNFDYPKDKIKHYFVTDGSTDSTTQLIKDYPAGENHIEVFHKDGRSGKIAAVERVMDFVKTPIVVYSDANTYVNKDAIRNIVRYYQDPKVGAVAGEKRISIENADAAAGAGEGIYWKYESLLKKWDAELYSAVGAAGELFSVRTELYRPVPKDTIVEDFYMTLKIAEKGYRIAYADDAYAAEGPSASVSEELKRKIRIAAGGLQAFWRLRPLLNIFKHGWLTFQYISHRILRWTLAPLALPLLFVMNIFLAMQGNVLYQALLVAQIAFYVLAIIGYIMERRKLKFKAFFVPYYFCMMNYAVYRGFGRIMGGKQSVVWEKAKRA